MARRTREPSPTRGINNTFKSIQVNFAETIFYSNPNSGKNFAKLYLIFQKLDHLRCNNILELV